MTSQWPALVSVGPNEATSGTFRVCHGCASHVLFCSMPLRISAVA